MIESFKHKGLKKFFTSGSKVGIQTKHSSKIRLQLAALNTAINVDDMNFPGWDLHKLSGDMKNIHSIKVNGNWRITFYFNNGSAHIVNYEDYH